MGRPPKLTEDVKKVIAYIKSRHPDWSVREIEKQIPKFEPSLAGKVPGRTKINEYISNKYKKNEAEVDASGIDSPWHLGILKDYPLPAEDIAAIASVQVWLDGQKDKPYSEPTSIKHWTEFWTNNQMTTSTFSLTIREALWVSKLYKVNYKITSPERARKFHIPESKPLLEFPYRLWYAAKTYADYQRLCELAGTPFDTTRLDEALRSDSFAAFGIGKTKLDLFSEYKTKKDGAK